MRAQAREKSASDSARARIALLNLGIENERIQELTEYRQEGISIDYPEFPTQLAFISSFLRQNGYRVEILDLALCKWLKGDGQYVKERLSSLKEFAPDLVLMHSKGYNLKEAVQIASSFNCTNINLRRFVLMSHAAGVRPFETLQSIGEYIPAITYAETEPVLEFIIENSRRMSRGKIWEAVKMAPNVAYHAPENGKVIVNHLIYSDLNKLPFPDFNMEGAEEYLEINNYIPIALSRGCPYGCRHCPTKKIYGHEWRGLQPDKVHDLLHVIKTAVGGRNTTVALTDSNVVYDLKWFREICRMFSLMDVAWDCRLRPDWVTEEVAQLLASGKCAKVILSADVLYDYEPALASFLRKPLTLNSLKKASSVCYETGIQVGIYFIVDLYKEPEKVLPKIAEDCHVNSITLSCLHDYDGLNSSGVTSQAMKKVIDVMKRNGTKINICTGWGETSW